MDLLTAKYEKDGDILKITLSGEIDHHSAKAVREDIDRQLYYYRAKTVLLDLAAVTFMDSSGLGLLLGRYTHVHELGGELKVLDPSEGVERMLRVVGAERLMPIVRSEDKK